MSNDHLPARRPIARAVTSDQPGVTTVRDPRRTRGGER
jgi:hypothetical protein